MENMPTKIPQYSEEEITELRYKVLDELTKLSQELGMGYADSDYTNGRLKWQKDYTVDSLCDAIKNQ